MTGKLTWVWAGRPIPTNGSAILVVAETGKPGYRYYHRTTGTPWRLVAVAANEKEATHWESHRVAPEPVPTDVAACLDVLAVEAGVA